MKRINLINKRVRQKNEARTYINNVVESVVESALTGCTSVIRFLISIRKSDNW